MRGLNGYGDPSPWRAFPTPLSSALSFLNTSKYPPSLAFVLMTLGPALLALRGLDAGTPRALGPALVFGKVPLFYYVGHFALIHTLAVVVCLARYGSADWMFWSPGRGRPASLLRCRSVTRRESPRQAERWAARTCWCQMF